MGPDAFLATTQPSGGLMSAVGGVSESDEAGTARRPGMRLLFVVNHAGFFISHRLKLALAACEAGYEVHVATPRSKHVPQLQGTGITWHELRLSRSGMNPLAEWRSFRRLCELYRGLRPDLVHHVTSKPVLYGTIAARITGMPAVVNAISGMGHAYAGVGLIARCVRAGVLGGYRFALRHPRMRLIVQNRDHQRLFANRRWIRAADVVVVPGSGVDLRRFVPRPTPRCGAVRIVLASRLLYTKGVGDFVAAARLLKQRGLDVRCVLVGEPDPDNPASIPATVLQRWHTEGVIEYCGRQEEMPRVFADTDIVCLPTYYGEGIPKVLVEAAACGLPIVTTDWPGCREVVAHGHNGLLVPIRNPEALAAALETLARDAALRQEMGRRGRARVEGEYSLDSVIHQTLVLYRQLVT
jgi:glycosyltransferase involved in cell wall biosynthesis